MGLDEGELKARGIVSSFRQTGVSLTLISIGTAILLGVIDQFTSKIIPTIADYVHDLVRPPQFLISFTPPVDVSGGLSIILPPAASSGISVKEVLTGTRVFMASAGPGTYLLRLRGAGDKSGKELVTIKKIEKSGETWQVDTADRNWANVAEITAGAVPANPASAERPAAASSRLSNTRWTVTEQDYAILLQIDNKVRRSLLSNALNEVGIFELGTDWEKQHLASYADAAEYSAGSQRFPWGGAFVAWVVKQAYVAPPVGAAGFKSWLHWSGKVGADALKSGMIAIFQLDNAELPESSSRLLVGPVVRRQPGCIEVILGNIANRVVITCVATELLVTVRDPGQ